MPIIQPGQLEYVDRLPLTTAVHVRQKPQVYITLMSRTQSLYGIVNVLLHTVTIDENGIPNTISINEATPVPSSAKHTTINYEKAPTSLNNGTIKDSSTKNRQQLSPMSDEYVVD